ncbi:MAG: chromosome segregation protein SMC, partial [Planctomycetes bacterium]|nr:chromosome segregation protein SMC [Planctomycetota bacterium]
MYLKKLILQGFKSFADRTEIDFEPGLTCIVGPNGCGKSNVVDAFKWILGDMSAKSLRGSEMKDVIFAGTQTRKPVGFAEVGVVFENEDGFLPIDTAEVSIQRRLYRSGESEYMINGRRCRLRDIRDLFLDTGIGSTTYSILEQGKLDVLLQANPLDRRIIFEEAAGISKYRVRRAESLRQLARVEENLARLGDIIAEVERRMRSVKIQAGKARKYRLYVDRLRRLRIRLGVEDYRRLLEDRAAWSFRRFDCERRRGLVEVYHGRLREALSSKEASRVRAADRLGRVRGALAAARSREEGLEGRIEDGRARIADLDAERVARDAEIRETEERLERIASDLVRVQGERLEIAADTTAVGEQVTEAERTLRQVIESRERLAGELARSKDELFQALSERARAKNRLASADAERAQHEGRGRRIDERALSLADEVGRARDEAARLRARAAAAAAEGARLEGDIERRLSLREERIERSEEIARVLGERTDELNRKRSRYEVLDRFEADLEGVAKAAREVLRGRARPEFSGIHDIVANLVRTDSTYAVAVEVALGPWSQALVASDVAAAETVLAFAQEANLGPAAAIPLDRIGPLELAPLPSGGRIVGRASELVRTAPEYRDLVRSLLGSTLVVPDLDAARELSPAVPSFRLVTLDGEGIEPWGGRFAGGTTGGIISRRSEMEDLSLEVERLTGEVETLSRDAREVREELDRESRELEALREARQGWVGKARSSLEVAAEIAKRIGGLEREIALGRAELAEIASEIGRLRGEREEAIAALDEVEVRCGRLESELARRESELDRIEAERSHRERVRTDLRIKAAQLEEKAAAVESRLRELEFARAERGERLEVLRRELETNRRRRRETEETIAAAESERARAARQVRALEGGAERARERETELAAAVDALRVDGEAVHQEIEGLRAELESIRLKEKECETRSGDLRQRLRDEYGVDVAERAEAASPETSPAGDGTAVAADGAEESDLPADLPADPETIRTEIAELEEKIRRQGNVNLAALEELKELEERYSFQTTQRDDLTRSRKNLVDIINEINQKSRTLFSETFARVAEAFAEIFRKIFGGGKAELLLENDKDILEAGIEIVARPP